jgi:hypothetical protein
LSAWAFAQAFAWVNGGWARTVSGFDLFGGKGVDGNPTTKRNKKWLVNGERYTCVVKVRKGSIEGYLNDSLVSTWQSDFQDMSIIEGFRLRHDNTVGFGAHLCSVNCDFAELIEIAGHGKNRVR